MCNTYWQWLTPEAFWLMASDEHGIRLEQTGTRWRAGHCECSRSECPKKSSLEALDSQKMPGDVGDEDEDHWSTGWWFGCHFLNFPMTIGLRSSSQLTNSIIFQRGGLQTTNHWSISIGSSQRSSPETLTENWANRWRDRWMNPLGAAGRGGFLVSFLTSQLSMWYYCRHHEACCKVGLSLWFWWKKPRIHDFRPRGCGTTDVQTQSWMVFGVSGMISSWKLQALGKLFPQNLVLSQLNMTESTPRLVTSSTGLSTFGSGLLLSILFLSSSLLWSCCRGWSQKLISALLSFGRVQRWFPRSLQRDLPQIHWPHCRQHCHLTLHGRPGVKPPMSWESSRKMA